MKAVTFRPRPARTALKTPSPVPPTRSERPSSPGPATAFSDLAIEPSSPGPNTQTPVVQRVSTRSQAKKAEEEKKKKKASAKTRLARWRSRESKRAKFKAGRYDHPLGPVTVSPGYNNQLMAQTRKADYDGNTLGSIPAYGMIRRHTAFAGAGRALYDKKFGGKGLTAMQKMAAVLAATTSNVSENDRAPGMGKLIRALARRHERVPDAPHFLDPTVNPAVGTAQEARDLVEGKTALNAHQKAAIDDDASGSSDDEAETYALRTGLLKKQASK